MFWNILHTFKLTQGLFLITHQITFHRAVKIKTNEILTYKPSVQSILTVHKFFKEVIWTAVG